MFGLALAGSVALPFHPDSGRSLLDALLEAFGRGWFDGSMTALVVLPPYAIGLFVAMATFTGGRRGATLVKVPLVLLQLEALLLALMLLDANAGRATLAFLGFTIVMALRLLARAAASRSRGTHASLGWLARTGGLLVAGTFGWLRLQASGDEIGIAISATMITAALMAATARVD
jgi:hypothetical protein